MANISSVVWYMVVRFEMSLPWLTLCQEMRSPGSYVWFSVWALVLRIVDWIYSLVTIASLYYVWRAAVCWLNLFSCYHRVFILCMTCCCLLIEPMHMLPSRLYIMCDVLLSVDWIYSRVTIAPLYYVWRAAVCWLNLFTCYHRVFILCMTCCCLLIESIHVLPSRLYIMYDVLLSVDWTYAHVTIASLYYVWRAAVCWLNLCTCYHRVFILCMTCCCLLIEPMHMLPSRLYIMCDVLLSVDWIYSRVTIASLYYVWRAAVCWLNLFT